MKKGFASVYLVIIFASLVLFILVITEQACGSASASIAEDICLITGESLLSEFQPNLQKRYGILALNYGSEYLETKAEKYIAYDLDNKNTLVNLELNGCYVDCSEYGFSDFKNFSSQISVLGLALFAKNKINITEVEENLQTASVSSGSENLELNLDALDRHVENISSDTSSQSISKTELQSADLKELVSSSNKTDFQSSRTKDISDSYLVKDFLSKDLNIQSNLFVSISTNISDNSENCLAESEYILNMFGNALSTSDSNKPLDLEAEYVLFGNYSDAQNEKAVKRSLFLIRSALNLVNIYSSAEKTAAMAEIAAAFTEIPYPIALALVSAACAAIYAKSDVEKLMAGQSVPFLETMESGGSYEDYLLLMLASIPRKKRLARTMDIMQLNINSLDNAVFSFRDSAYGFKLTVNFIKKMRLPSVFAGSRKGSVVQNFAYE